MRVLYSLADVIEEFSVEMTPAQVGAWLWNHPKVAPREEFKRELSKFTGIITIAYIMTLYCVCMAIAVQLKM